MSRSREEYFLKELIHYIPYAGADPGISKPGGRGPGAVEFLGLGFAHILYAFVVRVVNNIQFVNIVY